MIKIEEYRPHFLIFHRNLEQGLEPEDYQSHTLQFKQFLRGLEQRLRWELPLLANFSEAHEAFSGFPDRQFSELLEGLESPDPTPELLEKVSELREALEVFRKYQEELPAFTDVQVFNEILILASTFQLNPRLFDPQPLQARLAPALQWLIDTETGWALFAGQFPQATALLERSLVAVGGIKAALGGLHTALEGEANFTELQPAGKILIQALKALAACESERFALERESFGAAGSIHLHRVHRALQLGTFSPGVTSELNRYFSDRTRTLESLRLQLLCDPSGPAEQVESLGRQFSQLTAAWRSASQQSPPDPDSLSHLLALCVDWEREFEKLSSPAIIDATEFEEVTVS